jgi:hypothetical protein
MSLELGQNLLAFGFPEVTLWIEVMLGERRLHPGVCGGRGSAESSEPFASCVAGKVPWQRWSTFFGICLQKEQKKRRAKPRRVSEAGVESFSSSGHPSAALLDPKN